MEVKKLLLRSAVIHVWVCVAVIGCVIKSSAFWVCVQESEAAVL